MAMVVNHNATSMNALGNLNKTQRGLSESFAKISSGLRINNAADDSAGTLETPESTVSPLSMAASFSVSIPAVNAPSSDRSR